MTDIIYAHMFIHFKRVLLDLVLGNDGQHIDQSNDNQQQQKIAQNNRYTHELTHTTKSTPHQLET